MVGDFVYAARTLRAKPAFTCAAVLTLSLAIGASTAIFSVTDAVLIRPLPYKDPGRLVYACADLRKRNVYDESWSTPDYLDLRAHASETLEDAAAVTTFRGNMPYDDGTPDDTVFATVSPNMFRVLGIRVVLGRDFSAADGMPQPASPDGQPLPPERRLPAMAIVSHEYFERRFGGSPAMLGKPITKNGAIVLVGVLEPGAELLFRPDKNIERKPDIWLAARMSQGEPRAALTWKVIARLRPGATLNRAQAQADAVAAGSRAALPAWQGSDFRIRLEPMRAYLTSQARPAILALMGAVIFLLLIACSNVANLFLVRSSLRARDLAVRTAMGATWWRLARQLMAEALLTAAIGSALGFALAWAGLHNFLAFAPANLPRVNDVRVDPAALAFSIAAGFGAALLFGLAPAVRAARPDIAHILRSSGRATGLAGGSLVRNGVVVIETALCFVLLVGSGLMFRSFLALERIDPGFDPHGVLKFHAAGGRPTRTLAESDAYIRQMQNTLAAIPGVVAVTAANVLPLTGTFFPYRWGQEDAQHDESKYHAFDVETVLPGYFAVMRTPIIAGREFNESDNNPDVRRMIIDEALAHKAFPKGNAVGQRILSRFRLTPPEWFEIVGLAAHQRFMSLTDPGREQGYLPDGFRGHRFVSDWALRTHGDPGSYAAGVRAAMAKFDRTVLITQMQTMDSIVERAQTSTRFSLLLIAAFAIIAAGLAGIGLYGVLSTVVRQRTAEIGVRMALGAAPSGIFGLMIGYGLRLSAAGLAAGLVAALLLTRAMTSMLVGTNSNDPLTYSAMIVFFLIIAAMATWIPAQRAAALDPSAALREE